jgi:transposase-like protein
MTRSKLSDREKQEIVLLFEQQRETIISLAERYQVSSSTIRRLLKTPTLSSEVDTTSAISAPESLPMDMAVETETTVVSPPSKRVRRRSSTAAVAETDAPEVLATPASTTANPTLTEERAAAPSHRRPIRRQSVPVSVEQPSEHSDSSETAAADIEADSLFLGESAPASEEISAILEDIGQTFPPSLADSAGDTEDDDDFDDLDDDGEDIDDLEELSVAAQALQLRSGGIIEVMPLEQAILPKICYLVVDRTAELVTRPLKDFGELGQVPEHEVQSCTLPVFDNHRIARRFSHRTQRIVKIPNGNMLKAACVQLSAKGITRLLVNGHIYAL